MQKIRLFEVLGNSDTTEGRGPMFVVARFSTYSAAYNYVEKSTSYKEFCVQGIRPSASDIKRYIKDVEIVIFDSYDEVESKHKLDLKKSALAKLSKEEIEALEIVV